jgi:hypothetical protein
MTAFQTQAFVPLDGNLSIALPEFLRGKKIKLSAEMEMQERQESEPRFPFTQEQVMEMAKTAREAIRSAYGVIPVMSKEEHLAWMEKFRGSLHAVDYSDLREETDREI